jgi:transposase
VTARESLPADLAAAHALILAERAARIEAEASQMIQLSSDSDL